MEIKIKGMNNASSTRRVGQEGRVTELKELEKWLVLYNMEYY